MKFMHGLLFDKEQFPLGQKLAKTNKKSNSRHKS